MHNIAILGFGTVGSGLGEALLTDRERLARHLGEGLDLKYILDLREFPGHPLGDRVVHDFNIILNDPEIELVAEMMGGSHPAYDFSLAALKAGKHVVTSNKEVVANFGAELLETARQNGVRYLFEASVGGGIPVLRPIINEAVLHEVRSVRGILNGTTNYILTQMRIHGTPFADALSAAQSMGYAEANPAADVDGLDAARKIVILAALAFGVIVKPDEIPVKGIRDVRPEDLQAAGACGGTLKLIGSASRECGGLLISVRPCFVRHDRLLAHVDDVFNAVSVDTGVLGEVVYYGAGAGKLPTAAAVEADITDILSGSVQSQEALTWKTGSRDDLCDASLVPYSWFISGGTDSRITEPMTEEAVKKLCAAGQNYYPCL